MNAQKHAPAWKRWIALCLTALTIMMFIITWLWNSMQNQVQENISLRNTIENQGIHAINLEKQVNHLDFQQNSPHKAWLLQQAQEYAQMAQSKLSIEKNIPQAVALLQISSDLIATMPFTILKQTLTAYRQQLEQIKEPQKQHILEQLDHARNLVEDLSLATPSLTQTKESATQADAAAKTWQQKIHGFLNKTIIIRHTETTVKPLLETAQQNTLKENLYLMLGTAQWAVLHDQDKTYHSSLNNCKKWLDQFLSQNQQTRKLSDLFDFLDQVQLQQKAPDLRPLIEQFKLTRKEQISKQQAQASEDTNL